MAVLNVQNFATSVLSISIVERKICPDKVSNPSPISVPYKGVNKGYHSGSSKRLIWLCLETECIFVVSQSWLSLFGKQENMEKKAGNTKPKIFSSVKFFLKLHKVVSPKLPYVKFKFWLIRIPPRNVVAFHPSRFRVNLISISLFSKEESYS